MNQEIIDKIKHLLNFATPSPWEAQINDMCHGIMVGDKPLFLLNCCIIPDAHLVCELRNHANDLLDEIERLQEENRQIKNDINHWERQVKRVMQEPTCFTSPKEMCQRGVIQRCDICEDWRCCDNVSPAKKEIKRLTARVAELEEAQSTATQASFWYEKYKTEKARVAELEVELEACRNKICTWKPYREHRKKDNMFKTGCGYVSCHSECIERYCQYCGGKIEEAAS